MIVLSTLGAPQRRLLDRRGRSRDAPPGPPPAPVTTTRATVIDAARLEQDAARRWLETAGEDALRAGLAVLNRALHAYRIVAADPHVHALGRSQVLVARVGTGEGESVADGRWQAARELIAPVRRTSRAVALAPQAHLAGILTGQERALACQSLALRAREDLDADRAREAALQLLVTLDAAVAELSVDTAAVALAERIEELRRERARAAGAAQSALAGALSGEERAAVEAGLGRVEAALRARLATRA